MKKTVMVGFRPGRKTAQERKTKILKKSQAGNDSFITLTMSAAEATKAGILKQNEKVII